LRDAGFINLIESFNGPDAYSYVFDGQWGYLDHALANPALAPQVAGVADWHINADEPSTLDYNTNFKSAAQQQSLYAPDEFRISDHDPVLVDLALGAAVPPALPGALPQTGSGPAGGGLLLATVLTLLALAAAAAVSGARKAQKTQKLAVDIQEILLYYAPLVVECVPLTTALLPHSAGKVSLRYRSYFQYQFYTAQKSEVGLLFAKRAFV
jgi:hypothetical protein